MPLICKCVVGTWWEGLWKNMVYTSQQLVKKPPSPLILIQLQCPRPNRLSPGHIVWCATWFTQRSPVLPGCCMPVLASVRLCDRLQWEFSHQPQVFIGSRCVSGTKSQHLFALVNQKMSMLFSVTKHHSVSNFTSLSSSLRNPPIFWNATRNVVVCFPHEITPRLCTSLV